MREVPPSRGCTARKSKTTVQLSCSAVPKNDKTRNMVLSLESEQQMSNRKTTIQTTSRHDLVMAAYKEAEAEYPDEEVQDAVLAAIPGLTLQDLWDHLFVDGLLTLYARRTRH
jgi:hypothetical protein